MLSTYLSDRYHVLYGSSREPDTMETSTNSQMFVVKNNTQKPLIQILISFLESLVFVYGIFGEIIQTMGKHIVFQ